MLLSHVMEKVDKVEQDFNDFFMFFLCLTMNIKKAGHYRPAFSFGKTILLYIVTVNP